MLEWNTTIEYVTELDKNDEVIEQDGVRVLIAPTAQIFYLEPR